MIKREIRTNESQETESYLEPPPPSLIKGIGFGPSKNCVTLGGTKFFARKGGEDKPEKGGGGGWCRNGGLTLFYYFTVQSHLLCIGGK